ncbi:SMI1/KNR4 family protein [Hyphomonas sp.]|uniref:SMI1/KNR4 family protein n=1 Tax=Hyphomonas sp. TaxID=87 RepID=UPI0039195678
MGVSTLSAALRISLGLALTGFALAAGLWQRSPWILPFMAAGFTSAYLFGQLRLWRVARNSGKLKRYWLQLPGDFTVQLILVSVLYLVGFGLSALFSGGVSVAPFAPGDAIWPLGVGAAASILGLYIDRVEGRPSSFFPAWMTGKDDDPDNPDRTHIRILPGQVSVDSFYALQVSAPADEGAGVEVQPVSPRGLSEDDITRAEARLGRALPDTLIDLYRRQNGGQVAPLCIPLPEHPEAKRYEHVLMPFGSYNDLVPAEHLRTVLETVRDYADPDVPGEAYVPEGAAAMIVLAQWYRETLFLDYNQPGAPRVGFTDLDRFDLEGRPDEVTWWPDFEAFFAALRHYDQV